MNSGVMKNPLPADVPEEALNEDARLARERGLKVDVTTKAGRGLRWEDVATDIEELAEAVAMAGGVSAYESGVFVRYSKQGRFLYWTSLHPDLLNSTVLSITFDDSE
jgi:hypothetical protein